MAYVFDDVHGDATDLMRIRDAAGRNMETLSATDRAAIFSTSGQGNLDFTDDRAALHRALKRLMPRSLSRSASADCPDVSYYMADLIVNRSDQAALQDATTDALRCAPNPRAVQTSAQQLALSTAQQMVTLGEHESRLALSVLKDVIRRIAGMPGQRSILLLSPGFLTWELQYECSDVIDHALRSQVVISAVDIRGLVHPHSERGDFVMSAEFSAGILRQHLCRRQQQQDCKSSCPAEVSFSKPTEIEWRWRRADANRLASIRTEGWYELNIC